MVAAAEQDQVAKAVVATVGTVPDVVRIRPFGGTVAAWEAATTVSGHHRPLDSGWNGPRFAADVENSVFAIDGDDRQRRIAADPQGGVAGNDPGPTELAAGSRRGALECLLADDE